MLQPVAGGAEAPCKGCQTLHGSSGGIHTSPAPHADALGLAGFQVRLDMS